MNVPSRLERSKEQPRGFDDSRVTVELAPLTHGWASDSHFRPKFAKNSGTSDCERFPTLQDERERSIVHFAMKVRIERVPPTDVLEGIDVRPNQLRKGQVYELERRVGKVLVVWGYAQRERARR